MAARRKQIRLGSKTGRKTTRNRRRGPGFSEALALAQARAKACANRPANRRWQKSIHARTASVDEFDDTPGLLMRMFRWALGIVLFPLLAVTLWTFLDQFSDATLRHSFWKSSAFWYFATGGLMMVGWFYSGLLRDRFLFLYVLGHELTHMFFIWLFRGRISDWDVSVDGGYVTTDKSNIVIALSPYFIPLWSAFVILLFSGVDAAIGLPDAARKGMFAAVGFFWGFHLIWTLWMIPRDQPDLRENGTFLSLMIIGLANILVLVAMLCIASPQTSFFEFANGWVTNAAAGWDTAERMASELVAEWR